MIKRSENNIDILFPLDGIMLTDAAGERIGDTLKINARVQAKDGRNFTINGEPLPNLWHGTYRADIILDKYENKIEVKDVDTGETETITVYFLKKGFKKYRFSLDDNIWFLQNLTENQDKYESMFEDPYLALLKSMHEKYGTKFHVNIYYETPRHGGWNLSQMTDKYKPEWKANSDWLRLSFHANGDRPFRPYSHVSYDKMYFEAGRVNNEIIRFAGEEAFAKTVTTLHFADCSVEGARALKDLGYKAFVGGFDSNVNTGTDARMYLDAAQCYIMKKYGFYYDKEEDLYFFRYNGGIQHVDVERIPPRFDQQERDYPFYQFKDICLHEQYFYPEFEKHQPNYYEKMDTIMKWCQDHGYEPIFMDELFEFNTH